VYVDSSKLVWQVVATDANMIAACTNVVGSDVLLDIYGPPGLPVEFEIRKSLFFLGTGGPGDEHVPIARESFDFYCYGANAAEARAVFTTLRGALHRKRHARVTIDGSTYIFQYAQIMSGPQDRKEPAEGWDLVYSSFLIHFIEVTV
jgi:hypothetical protein